MKQTTPIPNVLAVNTTEFGPGGITKVMQTYCGAIPQEQCRFDVVVINDPIPAMYRTPFESRGSRLYYLPRRENTLKYFFGLIKLCRKGKYTAIHVHGNSATMAIELLAAFLGGVPKRIAHCHTSACEHVRAHKLLKPLFSLLYTDAMACSEAAGNWIFGENKFTVLNNAVAVDQYAFSQQQREICRQKLGIAPETVVLGHVGGFNATKNQAYIVDLLKDMPAQQDIKLIFVGIGDLQEQVRSQAEALGLSEKVLFLGLRADVPELMQAIDVFLFPSKWEGLGVALVEAQLSGAHCIASENVPQEANLSGRVQYIPLENAQAWVASSMANAVDANRLAHSQQAICSAKKKGYDIDVQAAHLLEKYKN